MKKLTEIIGLHKFKNDKNKEILKNFEGQNFLVWYSDNTCEEIFFKDDLLSILKKDNKKRIRYIFDMTDRIIVDRNIKVEDEIDE